MASMDQPPRSRRMFTITTRVRIFFYKRVSCFCPANATRLCNSLVKLNATLSTGLTVHDNAGQGIASDAETCCCFVESETDYIRYARRDRKEGQRRRKGRRGQQRAAEGKRRRAGNEQRGEPSGDQEAPARRGPPQISRNPTNSNTRDQTQTENKRPQEQRPRPPRCLILGPQRPRRPQKRGPERLTETRPRGATITNKAESDTTQTLAGNKSAQGSAMPQENTRRDARRGETPEQRKNGIPEQLPRTHGTAKKRNPRKPGETPEP